MIIKILRVNIFSLSLLISLDILGSVLSLWLPLKLHEARFCCKVFLEELGHKVNLFALLIFNGYEKL